MLPDLCSLTLRLFMHLKEMDLLSICEGPIISLKCLWQTVTLSYLKEIICLKRVCPNGRDEFSSFLFINWWGHKEEPISVCSFSEKCFLCPQLASMYHWLRPAQRTSHYLPKWVGLYPRNLTTIWVCCLFVCLFVRDLLPGFSMDLDEIAHEQLPNLVRECFAH